MKKRYAIVSVDDKCPPMLERKLKVCRTENNCFSDTFKNTLHLSYKELAKEIVEFLGIKD